MVFSGRNLWLQKRYLVWGSGTKFHHILSPRQGFKHALDSLTLRFLRLPSLRRRWVFDVLKEGFDQSVCSFLFFDTSDYKNTHFIGVVELDDGQTYFTKIYKDATEAERNREKTDLAQRYFSEAFVVAQSVPSAGRMVALALLPKKHNATIAQVWSVVRDHSIDLYKQSQDQEIQRSTHTKDWSGALAWYTGSPITVLVMGHGDLSHWNCFWNTANELCLIDYEEIGLYVPMYDCFHLLLKPTLLNQKAELPMERCMELAQGTGVGIERVLLWLYLYLETENNKDQQRNVLLGNISIAQAIDNRLDLQKKCREKILSLMG